MKSGKTRVLIVDDSAFSRQTLRKLLSERDDVEVVAVAFDGADAIVKTLKYKPDIITLDLIMPNFDGFSFLRWLSAQKPTPVIVVSSLSDDRTVFQALEMGAMDFVAKPTTRASIKLQEIKDDLFKKIDSIKKASTVKLRKNLYDLSAQIPVKKIVFRRKNFDVLAIGASTGGPQAIQYILKSLPETFDIPVLITQHMPPGFTRAFAERINNITPFTVKEAEDGERLNPATVYICPGQKHLTVKRVGGNINIQLLKPTHDDRYVPSVDRMFESVAQIYKNRAIGVILTGMGNDGLQGCKKMHESGGYIIAESEESAVVYGMPREVIEAGLANVSVKLKDIPDKILSLF
ncbi:MAG: chemotaxis response regulator protein-glutamate methylesterase [Nitrospirae bacterium]|nr:chemotaxis response regulator protein-glutamate methylesterase [Nitrospirota bacterium]